jgi:hypothetical protein
MFLKWDGDFGMTNLKHTGLQVRAGNRLEIEDQHLGSDHVMKRNVMSSNSPTFQWPEKHVTDPFICSDSAYLSEKGRIHVL